MPEPLLVERRGDGVVLLTLNEPDRRNAMTEELTAAWRAAIAGLAVEDDLRAVVVTGAGSVFCAGGDLRWMTREDPADVTPDRMRAKMFPFYRAWLALRDLPVPSIAAVNGAAIGAGLCLALACDLRYAAPAARFGAPFAMLGMHPGMGAMWLLPEAVGRARAREMLLTGRIVDAETAVAWGLAAEVAADPLERALAVAATVAAAAPQAIRLTKAGLDRPAHSLDEALEREALAQPMTMTSADMREGLAAVRERRAPRFTGR